MARQTYSVRRRSAVFCHDSVLNLMSWSSTSLKTKLYCQLLVSLPIKLPSHYGEQRFKAHFRTRQAGRRDPQHDRRRRPDMGRRLECQQEYRSVQRSSKGTHAFLLSVVVRVRWCMRHLGVLTVEAREVCRNIVRPEIHPLAQG